MTLSSKAIEDVGIPLFHYDDVKQSINDFLKDVDKFCIDRAFVRELMNNHFGAELIQ